MPSYRHRRTGRIVEVSENQVPRYEANRRWESVEAVEVPEGTVAELLAWAGNDGSKRDALLASEKAGKNRKGIIDAL